MVNLITEPTRICKSKDSCLDIIATNALVFEIQSGTIEVSLSDHKLVYTVLNKKVMKPKTLLTMDPYGLYFCIPETVTQSNDTKYIAIHDQ